MASSTQSAASSTVVCLARSRRQVRLQQVVRTETCVSDTARISGRVAVAPQWSRRLATASPARVPRESQMTPELGYRRWHGCRREAGGEQPQMTQMTRMPRRAQGGQRFVHRDGSHPSVLATDDSRRNPDAGGTSNGRDVIARGRTLEVGRGQHHFSPNSPEPLPIEADRGCATAECQQGGFRIYHASTISPGSLRTQFERRRTVEISDRMAGFLTEFLQRRSGARVFLVGPDFLTCPEKTRAPGRQFSCRHDLLFAV